MNTFYISVFNFTILVVLLVVKLKQPARDFLKSRHENIEHEIKSVHEQLVQAQKMFDEFNSKLQSIDQEVRDLREQSKQDIVGLKNRIQAETERLSKLIVSDASQAATSLYGELRNELFSELSSKVLSRAEQLLRERLTGDDRVRIRQEFSMQLEAIQ